jgi:hypothetical protein
LEKWGSEYEERDIKDGNVSALVIKGSGVPYGEKDSPLNDPEVKKCLEKAHLILQHGS